MAPVASFRIAEYLSLLLLAVAASDEDAVCHRAPACDDHFSDETDDMLSVQLLQTDGPRINRVNKAPAWLSPRGYGPQSELDPQQYCLDTCQTTCLPQSSHFANIGRAGLSRRQAPGETDAAPALATPETDTVAVQAVAASSGAVAAVSASASTPGATDAAPVVTPGATGPGPATEAAENEAAAETTGVTGNNPDDWMAFLSALVFNGLTCVVCFLVFMAVRNRYPLIYKNNHLVGHTPADPGSTLFSWLTASLDVSVDDADEWIGLDGALLIEFCNFCVRLCVLIGIPLFLISAPMNWLIGPNVAGEDYLSYMSFGNVEFGSWLHWMHAAMVWIVTLVTVHEVFRAQTKFLDRRFEWLGRLPTLRANTLMVESLPDEYRSDEALFNFFAEMFGREKVRTAYVAKDTDVLLGHIADFTTATNNLHQAEHRQRNNGLNEQTAIAQYMSEQASIRQLILQERARVRAAASQVGDAGGNMYAGFVTFHNRKDAEIALSLEYSSDSEEFEISIPPEPDDVLWNDLTQTPGEQSTLTLLGSGLVIGLYLLYLPLVIGITNIAELIEMPAFIQPVWAGLAPTMGLQVMVAFLPTFLLLIFRFCFTLKADAFAQQRLQNAYFWFQLVFVVLITAIGSNVMGFMRAVISNPMEVPILLASTMPDATHFYMNLMVLQWVTHCMNMMRHVTLVKYLIFCRICETEEEARAKAEPEDQDYYGVGSRTARFTINMIVCLVYGTLCPPMIPLTLINFLICRVVYGYLIPFAETKKADLGGEFWNMQLEHLMFGLTLYTILMTGVLALHGATYGPMIAAAPTILVTFIARARFEITFVWEKLPFSIVARPSTMAKPLRQLAGEYMQPELTEEGSAVERAEAARLQRQRGAADRLLGVEPVVRRGAGACC